MNIEIVYVGQKSSFFQELTLSEKALVCDALAQSNILEFLIQDQEHIELRELEGRIGLFGKIVSFDTVLKTGDRIEIYRPLILDPKEARRKRANKNRVNKIKQLQNKKLAKKNRKIISMEKSEH